MTEEHEFKKLIRDLSNFAEWFSPENRNRKKIDDAIELVQEINNQQTGLRYRESRKKDRERFNPYMGYDER